MQVLDEIAHARLICAPMAGITDQPFRQLARQFGADWAVCEMVTDNPALQQTQKTLHRQNHEGENGTVVVQIAGSLPEQMAKAAQYNVSLGAQVIDINMGCPAKKVCNVFAGSALLQDEDLVARILHEVVQAVDVPVTLKTRLGWHDKHKNIATIAQLAEQAGIVALAIHGRTREQMYRGDACYELITQVKQHSRIPIWANGDIDSPHKAAQVLTQTKANAIMIGRAAQGQPWLFADIKHYLQYGTIPPRQPFVKATETVLAHIHAIHQFYGEKAGVRIARKHIGWYLARLPDSEITRRHINTLEHAAEQWDHLAKWLDRLAQKHEFWIRNYD